jgi:hypothetical protein
MENLTAKNVLEPSAQAATSPCHFLKPSKLTLAAIPAWLMELGKKEFTPESTETLQSSMPCVHGRVLVLCQAHLK